MDGKHRHPALSTSSLSEVSRDFPASLQTNIHTRTTQSQSQTEQIPFRSRRRSQVRCPAANSGIICMPDRHTQYFPNHFLPGASIEKTEDEFSRFIPSASRSYLSSWATKSIAIDDQLIGGLAIDAMPLMGTAHVVVGLNRYSVHPPLLPALNRLIVVIPESKGTEQSPVHYSGYTRYARSADVMELEELRRCNSLEWTLQLYIVIKKAAHAFLALRKRVPVQLP